MNQPKVHRQDNMAFPSAEDRAALRARYAGSVPNTNELARQAAAAIHPQTRGATVEMVSEPMAVQPSPRVLRARGIPPSGSISDPRPGPTVDPSLVAAIEGQTGSQMPAPTSPAAARKVEEYPLPPSQWHEPPRPHPIAANVESTVRNPMPGYVTPVADSGGVSFALPSRFAYYPFKDLYICPFRNGHLAKLQRSMVENSLQHMVEAVSTVIYTSDPQYKNLAFDLTMPDFFAVLHWLRLNSFTKMSFTHRDTCRNPEHLQKVKDKKWGEDSLKLTAIIDKTTLKVHDLEFIPDPAVYTLGDDSPFVLGPPTMRDVLEFIDHPMMRNADTRIEFAYLAQKVSHLHGRHEYVSIDDRIEFFENLDLGVGKLLKDFETALDGYGVEEYVTMNCKVCGASRKSHIVLDASSFLSFD